MDEDQPESSQVPPPRVPASRAPGKRELTRSQNQALIVEAARKVFAELGYTRTTVRDIIHATPLAAGTFYNYFKSKEEIFQAIRDQTAVKVRPLLREARRRATTAEDFILGTFQTFFEFVVSENRGLGTSADSSDAMHVRVDTPEIIAGFGELQEDIVVAMATGLLPRVDPGFLTATIAGIAFEVSEAMMRRDPPDPDLAARFATALVLGGVAAVPRNSMVA